MAKTGFKFTDSIQDSEDASITPKSPEAGYRLAVYGIRDGWKNGDYWGSVQLKHPLAEIDKNQDFAGKRYDYFLGLGLNKRSQRSNLVRLQKCLGFDADHVMDSLKDLIGREGMFEMWVSEDSETLEKKNGVKPKLPKVTEPDADEISDEDDEYGEDEADV